MEKIKKTFLNGTGFSEWMVSWRRSRDMFVATCANSTSGLLAARFVLSVASGGVIDRWTSPEDGDVLSVSPIERQEARGLVRRGGKGSAMKRKARSKTDDMLPEYDFDYATAVRGKYYRRLVKEGASVVVLEPDVAKAFRSSAAVNEALRSLLEVSESTRRLTRSSGRSRVTRLLQTAQGARHAACRGARALSR